MAFLSSSPFYVQPLLSVESTYSGTCTEWQQHLCPVLDGKQFQHFQKGTTIVLKQILHFSWSACGRLEEYIKYEQQSLIGEKISPGALFTI
jgi:hypothetical protein